VKRCSNIEGADFKERSTTQSSSTSVQFNAKADDGEMYVPAAATATSSTSSTAKRTSTISHQQITRVSNAIAGMAISRGQDCAKTVLGVMCQIEGMIRNNGQLHKGSTDEILDAYSHTFSGSQTSAVSFSLNAAPPAPPKRPGSRAPESRMKGASMEAVRQKQLLLVAGPKTNVPSANVLEMKDVVMLVIVRRRMGSG